MLKIYGSMMCPDCVKCREDLDRAGVAYVYMDLAEHLRNVKEFLTIRDTDPAFQEIRGSGRIGIPCIVTEEGKVSLNWEKFI